MPWTRITCAFVATAVLLLAVQVPANAAMVATTTLLESGKPQDVTTAQARLMELGVDSEMAADRAAALTPGERDALVAQAHDVPAGGDVVGALAFAALVLLLTDILGYTDVYPFVTRTVNGDKQALNPRDADCAQAGPGPTAAATQ